MILENERTPQHNLHVERHAETKNKIFLIFLQAKYTRLNFQEKIQASKTPN